MVERLYQVLAVVHSAEEVQVILSAHVINSVGREQVPCPMVNGCCLVVGGRVEHQTSGRVQCNCCPYIQEKKMHR